MKTINIRSENRSCAGCTACCDGWASGTAHGHSFYPGKRCHFVGELGCTIYEDRPENPCKSFRCMWLTNTNLPMWLKPNLSGALIAEEELQGIKFITVKEMGKKIDSAVLSWLVQAQQNKVIENIKYEVNGGWNFLGTKDFLAMMRSPAKSVSGISYLTQYTF
jgi:hypothetical protein